MWGFGDIVKSIEKKNINVKLFFISLFIFIVLISIFVISVDQEINISGNITRVDDCKTSSYTEEQATYGSCTTNMTYELCVNNNGTITCTNTTKTVSYDCVTAVSNVAKDKTLCSQKEFHVKPSFVFYVGNYSCSADEYTTESILVCDSLFDGNGDGVCSSGESCMKFVVKGNSIQTFQKNSRHNFIDVDNSYYLPEIQYEVQ